MLYTYSSLIDDSRLLLLFGFLSEKNSGEEVVVAADGDGGLVADKSSLNSFFLLKTFPRAASFFDNLALISPAVRDYSTSGSVLAILGAGAKERVPNFSVI